MCVVSEFFSSFDNKSFTHAGDAEAHEQAWSVIYEPAAAGHARARAVFPRRLLLFRLPAHAPRQVLSLLTHISTLMFIVIGPVFMSQS